MNNTLKHCRLPSKDLPVIGTADLIIAGATMGGLFAALKAASLGTKVFVISYQPYLGEDICGNYRYLFENRSSNHPLLSRVFPEGLSRTPFHVKKVLENLLLDHDVDFLYSSYVTDVLLDEYQAPTGVVITNRSGHQVIRGKAIIDATQDASVARLAGALFQDEKTSALHPFQYVAVGNTSEPADGEKRKLPLSPEQDGHEAAAYMYTFNRRMEDWTYASLCELEQDIRGKVWDVDQLDAADSLFFMPLYRILGLQSCTDDLRNVEHLPIEAFMPQNIRRFYIAGSCADVKRTVALELLKPEKLVVLGEKIGEEAASAAKEAFHSTHVADQRHVQSEVTEGELCIETAPLRSAAADSFLRMEQRYIPVIGTYDVVVVGGGTAGANVGISAARHGAKTLVAEYLHGLGGTQTFGRIGVYWDGYREGFTREIDEGVKNLAPADHPRQASREGQANIDWKNEWYRRQIRDAGGDIWFGVMGCGALTNSGCVKGVLLATPQGLGVVMAHVVVDATGSGDIAIAAGADYLDSGEQDLAVQGAGLPYINLDAHYVNTDWTFVDDRDVLDITRLYVSGKAKYDRVYDIGKLPQTRERRRIVGEHMVSVLDVINHRRYPDTLSFHKSSFDTHGYTIDPYFTLSPPEKRHMVYDADVPLASLLPRGLDNILVTGLGASAHRDAMPVIRMQPCLQNQGYSVGYLCALAVRDHCSVRQVDIKEVQAHLVDRSILPKRVLTDTDNVPFTDEQLQTAAKRLPRDFSGLSILLTEPVKAEELLVQAYDQAVQDRDKAVYAQVLCMLGHASGNLRVIERVRAFAQWDDGWNYTGMGQFGPCMSELDRLIMALGGTQKQEALPIVLEKAKQLTPEHTFSHFRAVSLACEAIGSPAAAPVLAELLDMAGMTGHHVTSLKYARDTAVPSTVDVAIRNKALREIHLARALYHCGDVNQKGARILQQYANDLHGYYARHAWQALNSKV